MKRLLCLPVCFLVSFLVCFLLWAAPASADTLAGGLDTPYGLATAGGQLYFGTLGPGPMHERGKGSVMKLPLAGGTPIVLAAGQTPWGIAADDGFVYWTNHSEGAVMKLPLSGGKPIVLAEGEGDPGYLVADDTHLYWTSSVRGMVMRLAKAGGFPEVVADAEDWPDLLALDRDRVYWESKAGVRSASKSGGAARTLFIRPTDFIRGLVVGGDRIYFSSTSQVFTGKKSGGRATVFAKMPEWHNLEGLIADEHNLYGFDDKRLLAVDKRSGQVRQIATAQVSPFQLVVTGGTLYWTDYGHNETGRGSLGKIALPR